MTPDKQALRMRNYLDAAFKSGVKLLHLSTDELKGLLDELESETSYREGAFVACNRWHDKFREAEAKLEAAEKRNSDLSAALKDLIGVVNTVNRSRHHEIKMDDDDEPCYWQRKEWIEYLMETVNAAESVYRAAGIKIKGE